MIMKKILGDVLADIKPDALLHKTLNSEINVFLKKLNSRLKKYSAKAMLGGSFAKDTWLKGDHDVDVFVKFSLKQKGKNLSDLLEKALAPWKPERVHGSRDYFWLSNRFKYELVPVLDIRKPADAENVMDFSPLHVAWVNRHGRKYKDDIRLAKKFCKANRIYGAESYIRGFSGHVLDIIVINSGGFVKLLKKAADWKEKVVVDPMNVHKGKALLVLNASKIQGPLVVVDPVQPGRNAAAALAVEPFGKLVKMAREFMKKPGRKFFEEQKFDREKQAGKGMVLSVSVETLPDKEDIAGTKFVGAYQYLKDRLEDFKIIDSGWEWDRKRKGLWWFVVRNPKLSKTIEHQGPPVKFAQYAAAFRKQHRKVFVKKGRLCTMMPRKYAGAGKAVEELLQEEQVVSRVKSARP